MTLYREINFENDVCAHLGANGWLYDEGDAQNYDCPRALHTPAVLAWLQATQPQAWDEETGEQIILAVSRSDDDGDQHWVAPSLLSIDKSIL
jgi:hypothetical protein